MNNRQVTKRTISEDWLALLIGGTLLVGLLAVVLLTGNGTNPLEAWLTKPGKWIDSPLESLHGKSAALSTVAVLLGALFAVGVQLRGENVRRFAVAYGGLFALGLLAFLLSQQKVVSYYGLGYFLWAIVIGLLISNTVGTPAWLRPAILPEMITKVGLVLLGAEVLLGKLVALGLPGIGIAWVVTPIVLCTTYWFGQRVLRIASPTLTVVIAADMSVCGVSAAIATSAACRAKKEELSLAIGLSAAFTAVMMIVMPAVVAMMGLGPVVGGAWIGGTIDSTGAVGAAGALLGSETDDTALIVATTVKMIQNVLIGVIAFAVATYWVTVVERGEASDNEPRPGLGEIWTRFPKFILGFLGASILFSLIHQFHPEGEQLTAAVISGSSKTLRNWCFCLAFVGIGLQSDFRVLRQSLDGGKPLLLYVCGQSLNLVLTLLMSYLMFEWVFPEVADALAGSP